jgi:enterochelin esterase-like enzyme
MRFFRSSGRFIVSLAILALSGTLLLGCQATELSISTSVPVPDELDCEKPGTVEEKLLEETSRGYDYSYWVYLPPCYESDVEMAYPVLYLLPGRGGNPSHWFNAGVHKIADDMILSGKIAPFIIISTEEISSDPLAEIIYNELMPHVEDVYRVKPERWQRAVAGGSLGSVGAYRIALQHPNEFASVGMFGGGLIHGEEERVQTWLDVLTAENKPRFFINSGEQDPLMVERAEVMIAVLSEAQLEHTEIFSPGGHDYGYWASNFPVYFEWLAEDWEQDAG